MEYLFEENVFSATNEALKEFEEKKKLVIIKSSKNDVFCAGADLKEISQSSVERVKDEYRTAYRGFHLIGTYKIPYIAMMSGWTFGGAAVFTMSGKYRIATEKTVFAMPEGRIGFFNDSGASFFLSRLDKNVGIYLGLTGAHMASFDVKKSGIATHFIESKNLRELERNLVNCKNHDDVENVLDEFSFTPSSRETKFDENIETIDECFVGLTIEQIFDNLKRDGSEFALKTIELLRKMSPTSLKITHRQLNLGRYMSMEDCARMEFRMAANFATKSDLQEGCRAMLVDKDFKPKWNPPTIEEVSDVNISRFFGPPSDCDELTFLIKRSSEEHYVKRKV